MKALGVPSAVQSTALPGVGVHQAGVLPIPEDGGIPAPEVVPEPGFLSRGTPHLLSLRGDQHTLAGILQGHYPMGAHRRAVLVPELRDPPALIVGQSVPVYPFPILFPHSAQDQQGQGPPAARVIVPPAGLADRMKHRVGNELALRIAEAPQLLPAGKSPLVCVSAVQPGPPVGQKLPIIPGGDQPVGKTLIPAGAEALPVLRHVGGQLGPVGVNHAGLRFRRGGGGRRHLRLRCTARQQQECQNKSHASFLHSTSPKSSQGQQKTQTPSAFR